MKLLKRSWPYAPGVAIGSFLCVLAGQIEDSNPRLLFGSWLCSMILLPLPGIGLLLLASQLNATREWLRGYRDGIDDGNSNATRAEIEKARNDGYAYGFAQGIQEGRLEGMTNGLKAGWSMAQNPTVAGVVGDIIDGEEV